jgi:hypothetical protein
MLPTVELRSGDPGDVEIIMLHLESLRFISRPECRTCLNITL